MLNNKNLETWVDLPVCSKGLLIGEVPSRVKGTEMVIDHFNRMPLEQLPLYINHEDIAIRSICQERLSGKKILDIFVSWGYSLISPNICYLSCRVRVS